MFTLKGIRIYIHDVPAGATPIVDTIRVPGYHSKFDFATEYITRDVAKDVRAFPISDLKNKLFRRFKREFGFVPTMKDFANDDCWILKGNENQYPSLIVGVKNYRLHHVTKLVYEDEGVHDTSVVPGVSRDRVDLSHLCHRKRCANTRHLLFEKNAANILRNKCRNAGKCICNAKIKCKFGRKVIRYKKL